MGMEALTSTLHAVKWSASQPGQERLPIAKEEKAGWAKNFMKASVYLKLTYQHN
jgi:hypothetical protein